MSEHTPGPWVLHPRRESRVRGGRESTRDDWYSQWRLEIDVISDNLEADRNLIASAPDLLAACEAALEWYEPPSEGACMEVAGACPDCYDRLVLHDKLAAAIAKARGGSS